MTSTSKKRRRRKRAILAVAAVVFALFALPLSAHFSVLPIRFNQFSIQELRLSKGAWSLPLVLDYSRSLVSSGVNVLHRGWRCPAPRYDDPQEMLEHVFCWIPTYAVAYPTEGFYYFEAKSVEGYAVRGNLRLADLRRGSVSFAYFRTVGPKQTHVMTIGATEGLRQTALSQSDYEVSFRGKTVRFKLPNAPMPALVSDSLLDEEELVGRVHDESGVKLLLVYNDKTTSFYFLLDPNEDPLEDFESLGRGFVRGRRTGFIYFTDLEHARRLLVGVYVVDLEENNYFDGPGDQVPFWLDLRTKLRVAYPNTMLGDGIDEHGVYLNTPEWKRIAISPFQRYRSAQSLVERLSPFVLEPNPGMRWTRLTKEWWNNPLWRKGIYDRLRSEGKVIRTPTIDQFGPPLGVEPPIR